MQRPASQDAAETAPEEAPGAPSSLAKAFAVLDAFGPGRTTLSIREISRRSGVARSTVHRIVGELVEWGALERSTAGLQLGVKLFELGTLAPSPATLREAGLPFAHHLHEVTGLTVNMAVREGLDIVYIEKITSRSLRVPHSRLGGRLDIHATGLGKAILAFSDITVLEEVLARPRKALTPKTIVDGDALRAELHRVRVDKIAYDVEESQLGLFCVAAPILGSRGEPLAAISVTGATELSQAQAFAPVVRTAALAIERSLRPARSRPRTA